MSHSDEIEATTTELLLVELLYGELDQTETDTARATVEADPALAAEIESYREMRELFRQLPDEEPPAALSAQLLHAAAHHVPSAAVPVAGGGFLGWIKRFFQPLLLHPAMAAAATFVLVAGVAGTLYLVGDVGVSHRNLAPATPPAEAVVESAPTSTTVSKEQRLEEGRGAALDMTADHRYRDQQGAGGTEGGLANPASAPSKRDELDSQSRSRRQESAKAETKNQKLKRKPAVDLSAGSIGEEFQADLVKKPAPTPTGGKPDSRAPVNDPKPEVTGNSGQVIVVDTAPPPLKSVDDEDQSVEQEPTDKNAESSVVEQWHAQARQAARDGECQAVLELGTKIRKRDATYYDKVYLTDKQLLTCLRAKRK